MGDPLVFFFGAWSKRQLGHYLYLPNGRFVPRNVAELPWQSHELDSQLCPVVQTQSGGVDYHLEGQAKLHYKERWSALAWWDRSADSRYSSNAALIVQGYQPVSYMLELALKYFAQRWELMNYPIAVVDECFDEGGRQFVELGIK